MNPMVQTFIGVAIRWVITLTSGHFLKEGIAEGDATQITAAILGLITLVWSMYQKYKDRQITVTALASPTPMSYETAKTMVASPFVATPPVTTPANVVPSPLPTPKS